MATKYYLELQTTINQRKGTSIRSTDNCHFVKPCSVSGNSMRQKTLNSWYPYQVWLMSLFIGPILWMLFISIQAGGLEPISDMVAMLFASFFIGMFFSLPVLLFYVSAYHGLSSNIVKVKRLKLTLSLLASLGIWITFGFIFNGNLFSSESFVFPIAYTISALIAGFIFKVKVVQERWAPLT